MNEYVGECYNIYTGKQIELINRLLYRVHPALKIEGAHLSNPTVEEALSIDPSESVRSKLIRPFLRSYFDVECERGFGGTLLHPLYPWLRTEAFPEGDPCAETILGLLLEMEVVLIEEKVLESDFVMSICRKKGTLEALAPVQNP